MKIPKQIKIGGHRINVEFVKSTFAGHSRVGECDCRKNKILISSELTKDVALEIMLHEIIEYLNIAHEYNFEHSTITGLASNLFQVIVDNPELFNE